MITSTERLKGLTPIDILSSYNQNENKILEVVMMWRGKYSGFNNLNVFNEHRYVYVIFGIVVVNLRKFYPLGLQRCCPLCTYWLFLCQPMKNMVNKYTVFSYKIPRLRVKEFLKFAFSYTGRKNEFTHVCKLCKCMKTQVKTLQKQLFVVMLDLFFKVWKLN